MKQFEKAAGVKMKNSMYTGANILVQIYWRSVRKVCQIFSTDNTIDSN